MSEIPPAPSPKKEVLAPRQEAAAEEFADDPPDLEPHYGSARLWLTARDPHCLFAYWEFRADEHPDAIGTDGRLQFFLRTYRDGKVGATVEIDPGAGNVFIADQSADSGYFAELGFFASGIWCFLARSVETRTPPEISEAREAVVFATIPAQVSLGKMRDALAHSALPGESLAVTAARIQTDARLHDNWTPAHEHRLAEILGESATIPAAPTPKPLPLARKIQVKLAAAAKAAAPFAPIPETVGAGEVCPAAPGWPTSPGIPPRR